jgi:hypothetical protein
LPETRSSSHSFIHFLSFLYSSKCNPSYCPASVRIGEKLIWPSACRRCWSPPCGSRACSRTVHKLLCIAREDRSSNSQATHLSQVINISRNQSLTNLPHHSHLSPSSTEKNYLTSQSQSHPPRTFTSNHLISSHLTRQSINDVAPPVPPQLTHHDPGPSPRSSRRPSRRLGVKHRRLHRGRRSLGIRGGIRPGHARECGGGVSFCGSAAHGGSFGVLRACWRCSAFGMVGRIWTM